MANTNKERIRWFKAQFFTKLQAATKDTPFSIDLLCAIAMQETGYIWGRLYSAMSVDQVLELCVGDTLDEQQGRSVFPLDKADLLSQANGQAIFDIARAALISLSNYIPEYRSDARDPQAFCHGFGVFQYDLQFSLDNASFFLQKKWCSFDACLRILMEELASALDRAYPTGKTSLTDEEMVYVAIAYNKGSVNFAKHFKQGHFDGEKYYGEYIWAYLNISKCIDVASGQQRYIESDPNNVGSVAAWQNILNGCGYLPTLRITGFLPLDKGTLDATKRFQKNLGLQETGTVDLDTWRAGLRHAKLAGWSPVTPEITRIGRRIDQHYTHVLDYVRQPDSRTCQSACIAKVLGKQTEEEVFSIHDELEKIGIPGDHEVMAEYLKTRVSSYSFLLNGSLDDAKEALDDGCVIITHGWFTPSGHVICIIGYEADPSTLSYRFIVDDPWAEFDFPNATFLAKSGNNVRYSSYGVYAYCVRSQSYEHATELYASRALDSSHKGAWLHIIKN
jgi:hypothetical protein